MEVDGLELSVKRNNEDTTSTCLNMQKQKKVLHFSDGVMEEYSDSEDECDAAIKGSEESINVRELAWAPYVRHRANQVGSSVLSKIDYVGGGLASFLGITASEKEMAAAKLRIKAGESIDEEQCSTWAPAQTNVIVSKELKSSPHSVVNVDKK